MKHNRTLISIAMAALMLVSLVAVCASVSAAPGSSSNVQTPPVVGSGTTVVGAPAVCSQGGTSTDLFVRGANGSIYWEHSNDGTTWPLTSVCLGGYATSDPAAVSWGAGDIAVWVRGGDGAVWSRTTTNGGDSWSSWSSYGGQLLTGTGPAACNWTANGETNIGVFVTGTDHALWWYFNRGVAGWSSLGGYLTSSPGAQTPPVSGYIYVFVRGGDGALWSRSTSNGGYSWSSWYSLGGQLLTGTGPAVDKNVDFYVIGTDHALWWNSVGWVSLGGYLTSSPAAVETSMGNTLNVFARGGDNFLWERSYSNSAWGPWTSIGGI
jgi:hypothetical protein